MARTVTTAILETECIGDSLAVINTNFENLDDKVLEVKNLLPTTVTNTEIGYLNNVTSNVQDQLNDKVDGTGTTNYIPKWSDTDTLSDSHLEINATTGYITDLSYTSRLHSKTAGWNFTTISSLSSGTTIGGGDSVLALRNADKDDTFATAHQWAIHNDRSENNTLDFRYDNNTRFSILTSGEVSIGGVQASDLVTVDSVTVPTQVASTTTDFTNIKNGSRKAKGSSILSNWYRFSHKKKGVTTDYGTIASDWMHPAIPAETSLWDIKNGDVANETNSESYIGFISDSIYDNYITEVNISSTDNDDDDIGFVVAFYKDPTTGREYTLSLVRSPGNSQRPTGASSYTPTNAGITWALRYALGTPDEATLVDATNTSSLTNYYLIEGSAKWDQFPGGIKLRIVRKGNIIEAWTSNPSSTTTQPTTVIADSLITWDLNSDSRTKKFIGKRQYGFMALSQESSTWKTTIFVDTSRTCNLADGKVYKFNTSSWASETIGANANQWIVDSSITVDALMNKSAFLYDQYTGSAYKLIDGSKYEFKWPKNYVDVDDYGAIINVNNTANLEALGAMRIRGSVGTNDVYTSPGTVALKSGSLTSDPFISYHNSVGTRLGYLQIGDDKLVLASESATNTGGFTFKCSVGGTATNILIAQQDGDLYVPSLRSAAAATAVSWQGTGELTRNSSSARYKIDIQDAEFAYSENLILNSRPTWYRSNPLTTVPGVSSHSQWGFIAEEVAELDPRMVSYEYLDEDVEIIDGSKTPKPGAKLVPASVLYDRYSTHLVHFAQKQHQEIQTMKSEIESLGARLAALEAK